MTLSRTLKTVAAAALCTAATAQAALGAGEPKNTPPFIDPAKTSNGTSNATISGTTLHRAWTAIAGDAKNLQPFTRPLVEKDALARYLYNRQAATTTIVGEPKNVMPFTLAAHR